VCTTVPCPVIGENDIVMGNGGVQMSYVYELHNTMPVVVSAKGTLTPESLDHGTDTTSCTQKYSRILEDDGEQSCDAGHILANRLGGYGNEPLNIFPQNSSINRGSYAQFEGDIYDCMQSSSQGFLTWEFIYPGSQYTQPTHVKYSATFADSTCESLYEEFSNA
jgi:hypothetical protein